VRDQRSLNFTTTTVFMNIFHTASSAVIAECQRNFNFISMLKQITIRKAKFKFLFSFDEVE